MVDVKTRKVITVNDVSEGALRRFFRQHGASEELIEDCLRTARKRYERTTVSAPPVDQGADTIEDEDLLFELGLMDDSDKEAP